MTSMRIDGDKSAKVWARRIRKIVAEAIEDGCTFHWYELDASLEVEKGDESYDIMVYKGEQ